MNTQTQQLKKTLSFGKIAYTADKPVNLVEVDIKLRPKSEGINWETLQKETDILELGISGRIWMASKKDIEVGGQCLEELVKVVNCPKMKAIYKIWKQYHLNDLKAGTKKQTEYLDKMKAGGWNYDYEDACKQLKEAGLYEERGYKYGHGWFYMPIPATVIEELYKLCE